MKKWQKVVSVICLILCISSLVFAAIYRKNLNKIDAYFIFGNNTNYEYSKSKGFSVITDEQIESLKLLFDTYEDGKNIGKYYFSKVNSWNLFDKKDEYRSYNGYLFAYYGNKDIKVDNIQYRGINTEEKELISRDYQIYNFDNLFTNEVYEVDINNNDIIDKIICISNNSLDIPAIEQYNLIITIIDNKVDTIIKENNIDSATIYKIASIFSIKNKKYLVIEKVNNYDGDIESYSVEDNIYEYKRGKYEKITTK